MPVPTLFSTGSRSVKVLKYLMHLPLTKVFLSGFHLPAPEAEYVTGKEKSFDHFVSLITLNFTLNRISS